MFRILVIVAISVLLAPCQSVIPRTWDLPPQAKVMKTNGYETSFVERGAGPTVVLVHGTVTDYRYWASQMEPLSLSYRVVALSLRHFFPERWNGKGNDFSVEQHAKDLAAFITGLNVGPVHLIGHSRGGDVALMFAKATPSLLMTLTLADPAPLAALLPKTPEATAEADVRRTFVSAAIQHLEHGEIDAGLERFIDGVVAPGTWKASPESFRQSVRENAWSIKGLLTDAQAPFTCADAAAIKAPVLLITGERSPRPYGVMLEALSSCLKRHTKVTIPNAAHVMNRANPEAFNSAILNFLAKTK